jgi:hypothetical protein
MQTRSVALRSAMMLFVAGCSSSGSRPDNTTAGTSGSDLARSAARERDTAFVETSREVQTGTRHDGTCVFSDSTHVSPGPSLVHSERTISINVQSCQRVVARGYRRAAVNVDSSDDLTKQQTIRLDSTKHARRPEAK